jgi:SAM-dependent methyltransferase
MELPRRIPSGSRRVRQAWRYLSLAAASLDPRRQPTAPRPASLSYSEAELLRRNEEFSRAAEQHWKSIAAEPSGREHVLNKPFSTVRDTAAILYRLSLVLDVLDLGVGHTVLDFGAGSCWLSAFLNRLRCHTVSVDVSATALELGREAFGLDPRQNADLSARFVAYDGLTLPLESGSVDRVVCFDSFHHVPNQGGVLAEMFRVLRPGGRVVLAEPGEGHAAAEHSRFEASHFGVLENDLDLGDLLDRARRAGFDRFLTKPYPDVPAITLSGEDCLEVMGGDHSLFPMHILESSLRQFYLVALLKGEPRADSRNPGSLRARIEPRPGTRLSGKAGEAVALPLRVENVGDTVWLAALDRAGGYVSVGGHLLDEQRRPVERCFFADQLPRDMAPGEAVEFEARVHLPGRVGRYVLRLDLVDEKVAWFEQCGSSTVDVDLVVEGWPDSRAPHWLGARLELLPPLPPGRLPPSAPVPVRLRATNTGDTRWVNGTPAERGAVCLGVQLRDGEGALLERDHFRVPLARAVDPGETIEIEAMVPGPPESGRYLLAFDLVAEQICWFEHHGSSVLSVGVQTGD